MLATIPPSSPPPMPAPSPAVAAGRPSEVSAGASSRTVTTTTAEGDFTPRRQPSPLSSPSRPPSMMNLHYTSPLQFSFLPMSPPPTSPPTSPLDLEGGCSTPSPHRPTHWRDRHRAPQGISRTPLSPRHSLQNGGGSSSSTTTTATTKLPSSTLSSAADASREKRRDIFLKKVRREREESRWRARGGEEEMMRSLYVLERRRWEENQARASKMIQGSIDSELDLWMNIDENTNPVEIPDFIDQEDLEELIARNMNGVSPISAPNMNHMPVSWMHESESRSNVTQEHQHEQYLHPHPHSEDDLYDQLFREVLDFEMEMEMGMGNAGRSYPETAVGYGANKMVDEEEQGEEEMMDMSNG